MKKQGYQVPELRDENDNIVQDGTFGKESPLCNSTNDGFIDYVMNDLEALHDAQTDAQSTVTTQTLTATDITADNVTANAKLTAKAVDATTAKLTTANVTNLTATGETSVPTANAGNSSKAIANTEYVQGELTNYLPLSGGTLTGVVNGVTPTAGDNSTKIATTEFVNATAQQADWNVTDTTSKAFIKNKPEVYKASKTLTINDTRTGNLSPENYIANFGRRMIADFRKEAPDDTWYHSVLTLVPWIDTTGGYPSQLSFTTGGRLFHRIGADELTWGPWHQIAFAVVGAVVAFAGSTLPDGWLLCDGSAVSRTTYAKLFSVIGTTYGAGNGSTTFNLPNLVDKFVEGSATAGTVKSAGLPNIKGYVERILSNTASNGSASGAFTKTRNYYGTNYGGSGGGSENTLDFNASRSNLIYGNSTTVQPPALTMRYIIKY